MKLNKITIENFKGFSDVEFILNGKSTVIFGVNGTGKSSILSVINYLMRPLMNRLTQSQSKAYSTFSPEIVRVGTKQMSLSAEINIDDFTIELNRTYTKPTTRQNAVTKDSKKEYSIIAGKFFMDNILEDNIPIFTSYGINRSVLDIPLRIRQKHKFSQLTSLEHAIDNSIDFKTFFEWFRNQEDIENEHIRDTGDHNYKDKSLECVRYAIEKMLGDFTDLKVKRNPLRMTIKKGECEIVVDQLSDGEKCTLAMFGDLARRIALANPGLSNPLEGRGIVLIDEIELHMHPSWQRRVLSVLKSVFPNIQFIITTHSPQILGEVDDSYNLIYLKTSHDERSVEIIKRMDGFDSNYILESYMETNSLNKDFDNLITKAYEEIDLNEFSKAEKTIKEIAEIGNQNSPAVIELEGALKRGKLLYEKNNKG